MICLAEELGKVGGNSRCNHFSLLGTTSGVVTCIIIFFPKHSVKWQKARERPYVSNRTIVSL